MTTYTTIANSEIDQDSPVTQTLMTALRDNPIAITEGSAGAPQIQTEGIANLAITNAKHGNASITSGKLSVGARSFSGSIAGGNTATVTFTDNYAFAPRITSGNVDVTFRSNTIHLFNFSGGMTNYSINWRYMT